MAAILHTLDQRRLIDTNGIADGASIYFYTTGTLTPAPVYTTAALSVEHSSPIVVAAGAAVPDIYLDTNATYRRRIVYPDGSVDDTDPYTAGAVLATELASTDGAAMSGFKQPLALAADRNVQTKLEETVSVFDFMSEAEIAAVKAGTSTDDTTALLDALTSDATAVFFPPGTYRLENASVPSGKRLLGAGPGRTVFKIKAASTGAVFSLAARDGVEMRDFTIDGTGTDEDGNHGIFLSSCADARLSNIEITDTGGSGIWAISSPRLMADNITIKDIPDQNSWAFHIQGPNADGTIVSNILVRSCNTRAVMVRDADNVQVHDVTGSSNLGAALWFQNCNWCLGTNIVDRSDQIGDTAVIEGACVGTWIIGVTAKSCGGHGASIASNALYGAPQDCHIANVYCEDQGECIAAISDQGAGVGFTINNCSIRNIHGKNPGKGNGSGAVPSPAFAITNGQHCTISGSVTAQDGTMTYAVEEQSGAGTASNNRFEIDNWVTGTSGYSALAASSSTIVLPRLATLRKTPGDADLAWEPATDGDFIYYGTTLTADRSVTLGIAPPGRRVKILRDAGGSFYLFVKQGAVTIYTMTVGSTFVELQSDGSNWFVIGGGSISSAALYDYTLSNVAANRTLDASTITTADLADVVGTLITDLQARGIVI